MVSTPKINKNKIATLKLKLTRTKSTRQNMIKK